MTEDSYDTTAHGQIDTILSEGCFALDPDFSASLQARLDVMLETRVEDRKIIRVHAPRASVSNNPPVAVTAFSFAILIAMLTLFTTLVIVPALKTDRPLGSSEGVCDPATSCTPRPEITLTPIQEPMTMLTSSILISPANVPSLIEVHAHQSMGGWIHTLTFHPDGSRIALATANGDVRLWSLEADTESENLQSYSAGKSFPVEVLAFSPDGRLLFIGGEFHGGWLMGGDFTDHSTDYRISDPSDLEWLVDAAFSADGSRLVTAYNATPSQTGMERSAHRLVVWDMLDVDLLAHLNPRTIAQLPADEIPDQFESIAANPDGTLIAIGTRQGTISLRNMESMEEVTRLAGHTNEVTDLVFAPDGQMLASASADRTIRLWNIPSGVETATLRGHIEAVKRIIFTQDGSLLISGGWDGTVRFWDIETGRELRSLGFQSARPTLPAHITGLSLSPNGTILAVGMSDGTVRLVAAFAAH